MIGSVLSNVLAAGDVPEVSFTNDAGLILNNVWLIPAVMAASFLAILFFGKRMPKGGSEIGIFAIGLCFLYAVVAGVAWIDHRDNFDYKEAEAKVSHSEDGEAAPGIEADTNAGLDDGVSGALADSSGSFTTASTTSSTAAASLADPEEGAEAGEKEEEHPAVAIHRSFTWFQSGGHEFSVGMLVDGLSIMMLFVVTFISLLVHIYSTDYVNGDRRYTHFFAFLSLFSASMLLLVMSSSTVQFITAWELVGVCSFALIGHWWEEKPNSDAALKAFLTNRVGDIGLLVGMIILFFAAGSTFDILTINEKAVAGEISHNLLLWASLCLTAAVMSKSGQFILHTWLPDAMAGPTPVSALIHAATMVVAGVFMIAQLYPVFFDGYSIAGSSINVLAVIGSITVVFGGLLAFVQNDIKKVLAYSTVSQLGYMVLALGVGAWTAAVFHLFTHAFFKAGLFLGAGSVSHSVHSFDMKESMGGMRKFMPTTFKTFIICSIALIGIFPSAGFWSKDEILVGTGGLGFGGGKANGDYHLMLIMGLIGAALTAAYMTRTIYLTFFGEFRGDTHGHGDPHESGPRITIPLIILSVFAIFAGFLNLPTKDIFPESIQERFGHFVEPVAAYFPAIDHAGPSYALAGIATLVGLAGIAAAYWYYFMKVDRRSKAAGVSLTELSDGPTQRNALAKAGHTVLVEKYYLDHLYTDVIAGGTKGPVADAAYAFNQKGLDAVVDGVGRTSVAVGQAVYDKFDQPIVDGVVNATGIASSETGAGLRRTQTGKVQQYAGYLFLSATILAAIFIIII
ncbi:MAG: NADH-quinone oxidoreductase subunit L [Acidimicrobiales bacterium]|nr:NADH-quinone oxidoreductase subunit L [Acidimicrobiales bacterium]